MPTFTAWMQEVDQHLLDTVGVTHDDLPDLRWYDMWQAGMTSTAAPEIYGLTSADISAHSLGATASTTPIGADR